MIRAIIAATITTTRIIPQTMPALKIPPTTLQPENRKARAAIYIPVLLKRAFKEQFKLCSYEPGMIFG
jgi:hypothetical protein